MNTHIHKVWDRAKQPILVGLGAIVVGSVLGVVFPPEQQKHYCPSPLRAHFLERQIAFQLDESPAPRYVSSSIESSFSVPEPLREAAPEEPVTPAPVVEVSSESASSEPASSASSKEDSSASSASSESASNSSTSSAQLVELSEFPAFDRAVFPVGRTPNWGAMKTPAQWERSYADMDREEFVRIPAYDMDTLTTPMAELMKTRDDPETIKILTAKLFYSTRYFGSYDLDKGEFTGDHAGIDMKVPEGTPVMAIAGGRVSSVQRHTSGLGLHVIIEHRLADETLYSIYGHLSSTSVEEGQDVTPGQQIGRSGSTGRSTAGHLHVQIDHGDAGETPHKPYETDGIPGKAEAAKHTLNPVSFIASH